MIAKAKGISGSSFVSCSCCSAKPMCTPACQKPVPHRARAFIWAPAFRSSDILTHHQQEKNKPTRCDFVKAFELQCEGLKMFSPSP